VTRSCRVMCVMRRCDDLIGRNLYKVFVLHLQCRIRMAWHDWEMLRGVTSRFRYTPPRHELLAFFLFFHVCN
jgi:hypothetical protein